jgi:hypothetical protein
VGEVVKLARAFEKDMLSVVDELRERVRNGEITGLAILAEVTHPAPPRLVLRGRYQRDPYRAMTALLVAKAALMKFADRIGLVGEPS